MNNNTIRNSQFITSFGTGSIIDLPELSLMMLSPDIDTTWGNDSQIRKVTDTRLCSIFDVSYFIMPPLETNTYCSILGTRFPRTMNCPKCGTIHFLRNLEKDFIVEKDMTSPDMANRAYICPSCYEYNTNNKVNLIPSRFIIATEDGHIDDFPWDWYCHRAEDKKQNRKKFGTIGNSCYDENKPKGRHLKITFSQESAALSGISVECKKCGAKQSLGNIFNQEDTFLRQYDDYLAFTNYNLPVPWKGKFYNKEEKVNDFCYETVHISKEDPENMRKRKYPRALQRGAGNIYFSITFRGISLPDNSYDNSVITVPEKFKEVLKKNFSFNPKLTSSYKTDEEKFNHIKNKSTSEELDQMFAYSYKTDDILIYLNILMNPDESKPENKKDKLRSQEYDCFSNYTEKGDFWYKSNFPEVSKYEGFTPFVDKIVLLEKLKLLQILKGFTRIRPLSFEDLIFAEDEIHLSDYLKNEYRRIRDVRLKDGSHSDYIRGNKTDWLPTVEVKGEGVFIKFKDNILSKWENNENVAERIAKINRNYKNNFARFNNINENDIEITSISARYVLLHTISHVLINEIAQECGYNTASLSEIIYCNQISDKLMNGILIYTSSADAEGTLGGLSNLGKPGKLDKIFKKAINKSRWCSSDPLCISVDSGQGFLGVNLSACHSCCMLPETSCENINKFLDRGMMIGTIDNPELGFFNFIDNL